MENVEARRAFGCLDCDKQSPNFKIMISIRVHAAVIAFVALFAELILLSMLIEGCQSGARIQQKPGFRIKLTYKSPCENTKQQRSVNN